MKNNLISYSEFHLSFIQAHRGDTFSPLGLICMYDYLQPVEPVNARKIAYEYTEYENLRDFRSYYGMQYLTWLDIEEEMELIPVSEKGFIVKGF